MRSAVTAPAPGVRDELLQLLSTIDRADLAQAARASGLLEAWLGLRAAATSRSAQDEIEDELEAEDLRAATRALWRAAGPARRRIADDIQLAVLRAGDPRRPTPGSVRDAPPGTH